MLNTDRDRVVRRLGTRVRCIGDLIFVPVEDVLSGERYEPRSDLLKRISEMEALAIAAKGTS